MDSRFFVQEQRCGGWMVMEHGKKLAVAQEINSKKMAQFISDALEKDWPGYFDERDTALGLAEEVYGAGAEEGPRNEA